MDYVISSGLTAAPAAGSFKVVALAASTSTVPFQIPQIDISFDSTATGAGAVAVIVELVRVTAASTGGATFTPGKQTDPDSAASNTTARINDTTDGSSPTVLWGTLVYPTGLPFVLQWPLGKMWKSKISDFIELRIKPQTGFTAANYYGNLTVSE